MWSSLSKTIPSKTLFLLKTYLQLKAIENIVTKEEIAHNERFRQYSMIIVLFRVFQHFDLDVFKDVCCRFVVYRKGLLCLFKNKMNNKRTTIPQYQNIPFNGIFVL